MQIINNYKNRPIEARNSVVALGNFDGIHKGHQEIIGTTVKIAREKNLPSAVMTFEPHPVSVFKPEKDNFRLTNINKKAELIGALGIDFLFVINFDKEFANIPAEVFITEILTESLSVSHIIIGHDFIFGRERSGNAELLKSKSLECGYNFIQINAIGNDNEIFSSTKIRENLKKGNLEKVKLMLGRNYTVSGKVKEGDHRGKELGFPTINIDSADLIRPAGGVYAVNVRIEGESKTYNAAANIGMNPTFNGKKEELEVHIFNFDKDIYDASVEVEFVEYLRPEEKFNDVEALKAQISEDCLRAREVLL